ncbi:MAG: isoprenyl transferase [Alphaproteobacteria bacterium]|nr:isoprenyl transferase [Alphaproteobacteria bacterium]
MSDKMFKNTQNTIKHIAIIMDGNGRWAKARGLPRTAGHKQGVEAARRAVNAAGDLKVPYLTLFGFSTENWNRPKDEVNDLMHLLRYYLKSETADLHKNGVQLRVIGHRAGLAKDIVKLIDNAENLTRDNTSLTLCIALNYGGRQEILHTTKQLIEEQVAKGEVLSQDEIEEAFSSRLMTAGLPDPDILIRTSGEQRISNFLLWQCAYTEFVFMDTLWPDFKKDDLINAISEFESRDRRYGGIKSTKVNKT